MKPILIAIMLISTAFAQDTIYTKGAAMPVTLVKIKKSKIVYSTLGFPEESISLSNVDSIYIQSGSKAAYTDNHFGKHLITSAALSVSAIIAQVVASASESPGLLYLSAGLSSASIVFLYLAGDAALKQDREVFSGVIRFT